MSNSNQFRKRPAVSVFKIIIFIVTITVFVIGILGWTHSLKEKETLSKERQTLQKVLEREGYEGLLEMAGAKVHQIFYGDEGVSVFLGDLDAYTYSADEMRNIAIYERANRSVVNITTVTLDLNSFLEVLPIKGTGSGIIISESGYILTNAHVVQDAATMTVTLHDGTVSEAALVGLDNENDLAVLKIEVEEGGTLTPIQFGDGSTLKVGQKVVAIGNPFGYDRTMTLGTVSGLGRPVQSGYEYCHQRDDTDRCSDQSRELRRTSARQQRENGGNLYLDLLDDRRFSGDRVRDSCEYCDLGYPRSDPVWKGHPRLAGHHGGAARFFYSLICRTSRE